ncbi:MAG: tRNA glutamyl-Q(34) synthetase GluQRS, partial [Rhodobacteraceae bacterium]|nr:tRNA glutamyl-Q(34) synthetase GluQRS [Paracoccaceae bacterium]
FHIRIEDIDRTRSRSEYESAILDDLDWLGIEWRQPVVRQSERQGTYDVALAGLAEAGLCYPCRCTRSDIRQALLAPHGQNGSTRASVYPGTCRNRSMRERQPTDAIRLNMAALMTLLGGPDGLRQLRFREIGPRHAGVHAPDPGDLLGTIGDVVLARADVGTSYHLSVVLDDAAMGVTHVTRGEDIFAFTGLHRALQAALGLPTPVWRHHRLIRDVNGKRLAKRDNARSLKTLREAGWRAEEILALFSHPESTGSASVGIRLEPNH